MFGLLRLDLTKITLMSTGMRVQAGVWLPGATKAGHWEVSVAL